MKSTLENSIERILECAICQETMKDAVILHCGHPFCKKCLERNINSCPLCRKALTPTERCEKRFTSGLLVKNVSAALSDHMKAGPSRQRLMCNKHPRIERKYACERCRKLVCSECIIGDHFHKPLIQRPKDIVEIQDEMSSLVDQSEKWISAKKDYDKRISIFKRNVDSAVSAMMDKRSQMGETLGATVRTVKRLKKKLTYEKQRLIKHKKYLETKQKQITEQTKEISSHHLRIKEALQGDHPDDIIYVHLVHSKKLKDILSRPVPSLEKTEKIVNDAAVSLPPTFDRIKKCCKTINRLSASISNAGDGEEEKDDSGEDDTKENEDNSDNGVENSDDRCI